jgi:hypothetical protein
MGMWTWPDLLRQGKREMWTWPDLFAIARQLKYFPNHAKTRFQPSTAACTRY